MAHRPSPTPKASSPSASPVAGSSPIASPPAAASDEGAGLPTRPRTVDPEGPELDPPAARVLVLNPCGGGLLAWLARYALLALIVIAGLGGVGALAVYRHFAADLPNVDDIERYHALAPGVTRIYAQGGELVAELARENRAYAPFSEMPEPLVRAFLAAEDRRFFEHGGIDYRGLGRAVVANLRSGTVIQGGSTITQQVAKGFLTQEQTLSRKLREAILSVRIESRVAKEQILEIYLNKIFLGSGSYGVAAAASRYFGKPLRELSLAESALIAGLARAPSRYSPLTHPERAKARRGVVLEDMVEAGYISPAERDAANAESIALVSVPDVFRARAPYYAEHARQVVTAALGEDAVLQDGLQIETALELSVQTMAQDAVDYAVRKLDRRQGWRGPVAHFASEDKLVKLKHRLTAAYGPNPWVGDRFRLAIVSEVDRRNAFVDVGEIRAVLPLRGMDWASSYDRNSGVNDVKISDVRDALEPGDIVWVRAASEKRQGSPPSRNAKLGLTEVELGQTPRVEGALYTLDHETGYVIAVQGGDDYDRSQFNRAIQGCRQPGSVFKAIYYAYALDTGEYTMASELDDKAYEPDPGEEWNPENLHGTLEGKVLLRNAFIHSLNLPSIRLFVRLGADNVVKWARRLGFTSELIADKALSLGASCVHIDELSRALGIFVRRGRSFEPVYVRRVTDKVGRVIVDQRHPYDGAMDVGGRIDALGRLGVAPPTQVVDERTAFLITRMMRDVVTSGIGRQAQRVGVESGGKSGTASKNEYTTDTWFVGFTSRFVTAAWMGDDNYQRSLGDEDASYTTALPMWTDYMKSVVADVPHTKVPSDRPPGVRSKMVEYTTGETLRSAVLYFLQGTEVD